MEYDITQLIILAAVNKFVAEHGFTYTYQIETTTQLPHETVRQNLHRMATEGLLTTRETRVRGRKRVEYRLTNRGRCKVAEHGQRIAELQKNL